MRRLSEFLVSKRYWILGVMLCLSAVCGVLFTRVSVNTDMTKYLADDSAMKIGMDIMDAEFPDMDTGSSIRVMAEGLSQEQKSELLSRLEALDYVDSVSHDDSEDYNQGDYSLFTISTSYDYGSVEELSIEEALAKDFGAYNIVYQNDSDEYEGLTTTLILGALALLLAILFVMSESWFEPFLFLVTIGLAVVINAGTNIFLGEISNVTSSIAALLQLVLSMDYSIILINRYRQEKQLRPSNQAAMAAAVENAFGSIASSSLTTVVGLLALVFMNFKIGLDLGVVLAKGVFISMICVLTVLPCLILQCDRLITKTAKKAPLISMGGVARFSYRFRYVMPLLLLAAFFGFQRFQGNTEISYTLSSEDTIAEVFPSDNMLVMVYDNADEEKAALLAAALEENDGVRQVLSYPSLLARQYTAQELSGSIEDLGDSLGVEVGAAADLDPTMLELIYYNYYDGRTPSLAMGTFLSFLSEDVLTSDAFADTIGEDTREQAEELSRFSDPDALTTPKSISELAEFFDMDQDTVKSLMLYYYTQYGGVDTGAMTLPTFAAFVVDEVANDPDYSSLFDADTLSEMEQLKTYTDVSAVTAATSYQGIASMLGLDGDTAKLLFVYYYALSGSYSPGTMTLPAFVAFLQSDVMNNVAFSSYLDESMKAQIETLAQFTDKSAVQTQKTSAELAAALGMDEATVNTVFILRSAGDVSGQTMTLAQFVEFLNNGVLEEPLFSGAVDDAGKASLQTMNALIQCAVSGQALTAGQMAAMLGLDEATAEQLYFLYFSSDSAFMQEAASMTMTLTDFLALAEGQASGSDLAQVQAVAQLAALAGSGQALTAAELAAVTGLAEEAVAAVFAAQQAGGQTADAETAESDTAAEDSEEAETEYTEETEYAEEAGEPETESGGEDTGETAAAETGITAMTLPEFLAAALALQPENQQLQQINQLVGLALSGTALDAASLGAVFGMEEGQVQQLFALSLAAQKTVALPDFTSFLVNTVLADESYAGSFDSETQAQLVTLDQVIQLAAAGTALDAASIANIFGLEEAVTELLFRLYYGGDVSGQTMSIEEFVDYILSDFASDPVLGGYMDSDTISQLQTAQALISATVQGQTFTYSQLASLLGMDSSTLKMLFTYHDAVNGATSGWRLSLRTVVNFLVSNSGSLSSVMDSSSLSQLSMVQAVIEGSVNGTAYSAAKLASLLGMDSSQLEQLYLLYFSEHGDTSVWQLPVQTMVNFLCSDVLTDPDYGELLEEDTQELLTGAKTMIDAVVSREEYTAAEAWQILSALTDELDENTVELLYLYHASQENSDPTWTMSIEELFTYLCDEILEDARFASFIDEETGEELSGWRESLDEGVEMLKSETYSRMIVYTSLPVESEETTAFISWLHEVCAGFEGDYYLIGNSAMNYEMRQTFNDELQRITILTSLAIFLIVLLSFHSLIIPVILVLLVQCSVYITVTVVGIQGYSIYYLALLIVECILMGATIDYGILFTNYYREYRRMRPVKDSLASAYNGSIHTIMTSGLIIVLVTGAIGYTAADPTIRQIVRTISTGSLCAILMILFVLPGILAALDKLVTRKKDRLEKR